MFINHLKTALRNLLRNKGYTFINITGLSVGIAVCLAIFIFIRYEYSYDNFHQKKDRIYRILTGYVEGKNESRSSGVPAPLPEALASDFPQLQKVAPVYSNGRRQVFIPDNNAQNIRKFKSTVFFTTPAFFDVFDFKWLSGNAAKALNDPNSAIITKEVAEKYFGSWQNALGKTINVEKDHLVKISGVLASVPANTDFRMEIILSYQLTHFASSQDWVTIDGTHQCYILAPEHFSLAAFDRQLNTFSKKYRPATDQNTQYAEPLSDVHYNNQVQNFSGKTITRQHLNTLWLIAAFILMIACINFINLSTAQAVNRAKEVGVRKVLGSSRSQLTIQFLMEALLLVCAAVFIAVIIAALSLGAVSKLLDDPLSAGMLLNPELLLFLVVITVIVTLLAGGYPSLVISGFKPITALKSKMVARTRGFSLRKGLVVFQFIIAQTLIIATLIILKQMNYFTSNSMGFNTQAVVNVPFPGDSIGVSKIDYLRNRLHAIAGVQQVSFSNTPPANGRDQYADNWLTTVKFDHAAKETEFTIITKWVDDGYLGTYQLPLVAGRNITSTDSIREFLVNETMVKKLGFAHPEDVLNKEIDVWGGFAKGPVVGVVKDFHTSSLKDELVPVFMTNIRQAYSTAGIKLNASNMMDAMKTIEKMWNETFPSYVFEYQFLDERVASFYRTESNLAKLYRLFAGIAICLSCLGLFGLASFMAIQRTKEVGIRKVLGATERSIIYIFSKEFLILVAIAFVIASPLAGYFMQQWLQGYVYRISIGWQVFVIGGASSLAIALATISFHAVKAAIANPVKSLQSE